MAKIDAGEVVGYRIDLKSYINAATRTHIPEKGGYAEIKPSYVVRNDVVLFSGGRLAESLRAVSDWMQTPDMPGKGCGAIEVALSPFWADRQAVAIISNDDAGRKQSVDRLIELIENGGKIGPASPFAPPVVAPAAAMISGSDRVAIETPLKDFVPPALVVGHCLIGRRLCCGANAQRDANYYARRESCAGDGAAASFPSRSPPAGFILAATSKSRDAIRAGISRPTGKSPSTSPMPKADRSRSILPGEVDWIGDHSAGWDGGYAVSTDGKTYFSALASGRSLRSVSISRQNVPQFFLPIREASHYYETSRAPRLYYLRPIFHPMGSSRLRTGQPSQRIRRAWLAADQPLSTEIRVIRVSHRRSRVETQAAKLRDGSFSAVERFPGD